MLDRLKGAVLAFVIWWVAVLAELRHRIHEARHPKPVKKVFDPEHIDVILPKSMGPLVETPASEHPLPLAQVPVRSSKADAKREALAYARKRTNNPTLGWKAARQLLNRWLREEKATLAGLSEQYADKMRELASEDGMMVEPIEAVR